MSIIFRYGAMLFIAVLASDGLIAQNTSWATPQPVNPDAGYLTVVHQLQRAAERQDATAYSSLLASSGRWDGPQGQHSIGRENIQGSMHLIFSNLGPLVTVLSATKQLAPGVIMVDMYMSRKMKSRTASRVQIANGSVGPIGGSDFRTTLIVQMQDGVWKIAEVRIADLRVPR